VFEDYCELKLLQINPPKTELIYFQQRSQQRTMLANIKVCGIEVKCATHAKYLGVIVPCGRRHYENIKETKVRAISAAVGCLKMLSRVGVKSMQLALKFYKAFVSSVITYGMMAGHPGKKWGQLNTVYFSFIRRFLNLPTCARSDVLGRCTGYLCMNCQYGLQTILYCHRLIRQKYPELAYKALIELWESSGTWLNEVVIYGSKISSSVLRDHNDTDSFEVFSLRIVNQRKEQWKRQALSYCQSNCQLFISRSSVTSSADSSTTNRFLQLAIPGYIGVHYIFAHPGRRARAAHLLLTGSWRWAKENKCFIDVSKICPNCRMRDNISHLLLECSLLVKKTKYNFLKACVI
jgi:hypothetical protein